MHWLDWFQQFHITSVNYILYIQRMFLLENPQNKKNFKNWSNASKWKQKVYFWPSSTPLNLEFDKSLWVQFTNFDKLLS